MRRRAALLLLFSLLAPGVARAQSPGSTVILTGTEGAFGGGRLYAPVRFGNMLGTMRLDTGASTTRITTAPWNKGFPVLAHSQSTSATGAAVPCEDVEARDVALKASQGNDIARAKYEVSRCAAGGGEDLLGLDFFRGAHFSLDIGRRELSFFGTAPAGAAKAFRLLGGDGRLVGLDLHLGKIAAVGLFDTGAEITAVDQGFVDTHKNLFAPVKQKGQGSDAAGRGFSSRMVKIKQLDIGTGRVLRGVYALAYDFGPLREALGPQTPVILGYNALRSFKWDLDFSNAKAPTWRVAPR